MFWPFKISRPPLIIRYPIPCFVPFRWVTIHLWIILNPQNLKKQLACMIVMFQDKLNVSVWKSDFLVPVKKCNAHVVSDRTKVTGTWYVSSTKFLYESNLFWIIQSVKSYFYREGWWFEIHRFWGPIDWWFSSVSLKFWLDWFAC